MHIICIFVVFYFNSLFYVIIMIFHKIIPLFTVLKMKVLHLYIYFPHYIVETVYP